ncbi:MAG: hypothetical protein INH41_01880 [Myxococcaceae bacterium]|nr:hypothetical protein [Myxococcaceae bacterium]MCA3011127.1 hypothetical protein [Myxococcaceae bacterium]
MRFGVLVVERPGVLLHAAVRVALQPAFRRDGLTLGVGAVTVLLGWLVALFFRSR